jgi:hypothetical protein
MKKISFVYAALLVFGISGLYAQTAKKIKFNFNKACSYYGVKFDDDIYEWESSAEALEVVAKICKTQGLTPTFIIAAASVPNATALILDGKRCIYYSESFMQEIRSKSKTYWASVSVLAHEIGHHVNGHTIDTSSRRPEDELAADQFSGNVLRRLGATLEQAHSGVMALNQTNDVNNLYPPKSARKEAITIGWMAGGNQPEKDEDDGDGEKVIPANILSTISVHVRKDASDKLGQQIAYNYYLKGSKAMLDAIQEVRYVRNHNTFYEFQNSTYQASNDRNSAFNYKGYQWGFIQSVYLTLILKDGTTTSMVQKNLVYDN